MRRVLSTCFFALCLAAASVSAQDATIKSKTKINADDAKAMTLTGCLVGGPATFMLSNAIGGDPGGIARVPHEGAQSPAVGTSGTVSSYDLTPREGVDLRSHVGERVEISALMVAPATKGDDDAKINVKEKTKAKVDDAPDQRSQTKTKAEIARGPAPKLAVMTVRTVSPTCQ
jgi:hypothetical protein